MNAVSYGQVTPAPSTAGHPHTGELPAAPRANTGRIIGALFLVGFLTYGVGSALTTSTLNADDVIGSVSAHQTTFLLGAVLMLTVVAVDIGKAVLFYPVLGRDGRRTALTYLSGMIVEVTLMAVGAVGLLSLAPLVDHVHSGATSSAVGQSLGTLAVDLNSVAYQSAQATLGVGAFFLCLFLYRSGLVPRFLAAWGAVGYVLHLTGATAELCGLHISLFLLIPGGLFELAFAVWLIVKGIGSTDA